MTLVDSADGTERAVDAAFARLATIARRGLPRMLVAAEAGRDPVLCHRALQRPAGGLELDGRSPRYTAMTVIGCDAFAKAAGAAAHVDLPMTALHDGLARWSCPDDGARPASPGDQGLVLWAQLLAGDDRAERTAAAIVRRRDEIFDARSDFASMEMGFLLRGLAAGRRADLPGTGELAEAVAAVLVRNQHAQTGLFTFSRRVRRKNVFRTRRETRLGSFASQVYPTLALAALTAAGGADRWLPHAERCADRIAALQGPQGQWWWIYHTAAATPALRYPVYSVHQDAMGPMLLLAVALASGQSRRFDAAIARSLAWFDERPECIEQPLLDDAGGMVWRAVQRDDPQTTGALGLARGERLRVDRVAWTGRPDRRPFPAGSDRAFVCSESRPYHLGWILLAAAMWQESRRS